MQKEVHPLSSTCHGDRPAGSTSSFPSGSVNAAPVRIWEFLKWKIRWVRYSLTSELEATPQPCGNGDPFRPSAGGDVSSLFSDTATPNLSIEQQGRKLHWKPNNWCDAHVAMWKVWCIEGSMQSSSKHTYWEYDSNVGLLQDQCWRIWFFRIQQVFRLLSWCFHGIVGTFVHFFHKQIFGYTRIEFINLYDEFCESMFMVLENVRRFNYFKFSCPCLDPRLCVVKYMKVNCFSDCWHCWRRDQWRHSLVPSHQLLRRLLKHFVLAAASNFMILWIAILYT